MTDIVEAWKWRDPQEIIEALLRESERTKRQGRVGFGGAVELVDLERVEARPYAGVNTLRVMARCACGKRDRYYTQARRLHVKRLMENTR